MTFEEYRKRPGLNWSSLKPMERSARYCQWLTEHPRPDSPALALGRMIHIAILQPRLYADVCVSRPDEWDSWRSNAARAWRAEQLAAGREILSDDDAETIRRVALAIYSHADAMRLLSDTRREETIEWAVDGVACKGRVDAIAADRIVDLKTTRDLGLFVRRDAAQLLYHGQFAWYLDGAISAGACSPDAEACVVAVETEPPYDVAAFRIGEESVEAGRRLWHTLLDRWVTCRDSGVWPGKYPSLATLEMPNWAAGMRPEYEDDEEAY